MFMVHIPFKSLTMITEYLLPPFCFILMAPLSGGVVRTSYLPWPPNIVEESNADDGGGMMVSKTCGDMK